MCQMIFFIIFFVVVVVSCINSIIFIKEIKILDFGLNDKYLKIKQEEIYSKKKKTEPDLQRLSITKSIKLPKLFLIVVNPQDIMPEK